MQVRGISLGQQLIGEFLPVFDPGQSLIQGIQRRIEPREIHTIGWRLGEVATALLDEDFEVKTEPLEDRAQKDHGSADDDEENGSDEWGNITWIHSLTTAWAL